MKGVKTTSIDDSLTWLQLNAIEKEVLTETMVSDLKEGVANGEEGLVRIETAAGPKWYKTYIYKISKNNVFIDATQISDSEVLNERPMSELPAT